MIMRIIEGTFTAILAYLVIANADGFSKAIGAIGDVYTKAVSTLQGRG